MGVIKKLRQKMKQRKLAKTQSKELEKWESLYKNLQAHPLTQAKLINEELLATTNETLDELKHKISDIDSRLDGVENKVYSKKVKTKKNLEIREKIIVPYAKLSVHEKQIIGHIKDTGKCDASVLAEALGMSRSNASLKLNKLHSWNFLEKGAEDKRVAYWLKTQNKQD
tara:strand:+ start:172 stop:678 length:507 start_codon:yes stop_codon:yes gene_type:complete